MKCPTSRIDCEMIFFIDFRKLFQSDSIFAGKSISANYNVLEAIAWPPSVFSPGPRRHAPGGNRILNPLSSSTSFGQQESYLVLHGLHLGGVQMVPPGLSNTTQRSSVRFCLTSRSTSRRRSVSPFAHRDGVFT